MNDSVLPRLLVITEAPLRKNSTGLDRTLFNLLDTYPPDNFFLYTQSDPSGSILTDPPLNKAVTTFSTFLPHIHNKFGLFFNKFIDSCNFQLLDWLPIPSLKALQKLNPEVVIICPTTPASLILGYKVVQRLNCPYLIYIMDDWLAKVNTIWLSSSVQQYVKQVLQKADGWLMISDQLKCDLQERYQVIPPTSLIVHNPVDLASLPAPDFSIHHGTFKIIYAGSIWVMHYDAVAIVAETVFQLRNEGHDIEFILHTPSPFWQEYQDFWESRQVVNGGMIPYDDLHLYLQKGDLLLVASSFLPEYAHITRSSVQTKITDYMASGRPILAYGPGYSACNQFIKKWKCGLECNSSLSSDLSKIIQIAMQTKNSQKSLAQQAYSVAENTFDKPQISQKLNSFILSLTRQYQS